MAKGEERVKQSDTTLEASQQEFRGAGAEAEVRGADAEAEGRGADADVRGAGAEAPLSLRKSEGSLP